MPTRWKVSHFNDNWLNVDASDEPQFFVRFLDATRGRMLEAIRRDPAAALSHLDLRPGLSVLDAGCGVGDLTAIIAPLVAPGGRAIGVDLSEVMLGEATRRAEGAEPPPVFQRADVQELPFSSGSFDRTMATQLLVHVPSPERAVDELCRVTRARGLLALAEMDWDTLVFALDDRNLARRFTRMFADGIRNPVVVRELPGMLRARGIGELKIRPQVMVFDNFEFTYEWIIAPALRHASRSGELTPTEIAALEQELRHRAAAGRFFAASTFYMITGVKMADEQMTDDGEKPRSYPSGAKGNTTAG